MKRILAVFLLVLVTGCSQFLGTGDWDRIEVAFTAGSGSGQGSDYTLVVTPTQASYSVEGEPSTHDLPEGVWDVLAAGVRTLGDRGGESCADGQSIEVRASSGGSVAQTFVASSCDADGAFDQAKALIEQVISRLG